MIYYDNKTLAKMKVAELDELIKLFVDGGMEQPEGLTNAALRIGFIEKATEEKGYPYRITEDWLKANAESIKPADIGELKLGDVIFVPAPTDEDVAREELIAEAGALLGALEEEARRTILVELAQLPIEELATKVQTMKDEDAASKGNPGAGDGKSEGDDADTKTDEEAQPEASVASTGDPIADAIATGKFKYEGQIIIAYSVNVFAGKTRYELHAADRCTYGASKEEVEKIVNTILN